jgi:DNA-binding MarR family transcriptional regulator
MKADTMKAIGTSKDPIDNQERLNMEANLGLANTDLRFWFLIHRTRDWFRVCEDQIFREHGLTTEQYAVLATMKYLGNPTRPTDIARWLERSTNSISIIIDRMVKAGLIKRVRDKSDRRVVQLSITSKGENTLKPATSAGLEFIQKVLSPLSREDRRTLVALLETLKYEAFKYVNPGETTEEMMGSRAPRQADLMKRLVQYTSSFTLEAKR